MKQFSKKFTTKLSASEQQVLALVAEGLSSKEIAARLFLSRHTVNNHRKNMLLKWGAKNSAELVRRNMDTQKDENDD